MHQQVQKGNVDSKFIYHMHKTEYTGSPGGRYGMGVCASESARNASNTARESIFLEDLSKY